MNINVRKYVPQFVKTRTIMTIKLDKQVFHLKTHKGQQTSLTVKNYIRDEDN